MNTKTRTEFESCYLTVSEVIENDLPYKREPHATPCPFCGKLHEPLAVVMFGTVVDWQDQSPKCDCEQAQAKAREQRRETLRLLQKQWGEQQQKIDEQRKAKAKTKFTLSELREMNYPLDPERTPEPFTCEFCGKVTDPECIMLFGSAVIWNAAHCDCEPGKAAHEAICAENTRKREEEKAQEEQQKLEERVKQLLGVSGIKTRFMSRTFEGFVCDTPERENAYNQAKMYAEKFENFRKDGTGLYLEGVFGTGKTHLAVAIALYLIRKGVNVICKTSISLLMDIKAAFKYEDGEEVETARLRDCELLVIDDLGKEQCTKWSVAKLYEILNDRYENNKPVIITTNYSQDELTRRLTPDGGDSKTAGSMVSRLKETAIIMPMVWEDWRSK